MSNRLISLEAAQSIVMGAYHDEYETPEEALNAVLGALRALPSPEPSAAEDLAAALRPFGEAITRTLAVAERDSAGVPLLNPFHPSRAVSYNDFKRAARALARYRERRET